MNDSFNHFQHTEVHLYGVLTAISEQSLCPQQKINTFTSIITTYSGLVWHFISPTSTRCCQHPIRSAWTTMDQQTHGLHLPTCVYLCSKLHCSLFDTNHWLRGDINCKTSNSAACQLLPTWYGHTTSPLGSACTHKINTIDYKDNDSTNELRLLIRGDVIKKVGTSMRSSRTICKVYHR